MIGMNMDQLLAAVRDMATITARYYAALVEEGVPEERAGQMAALFAATMIHRPESPPEGP